MRYQKGRLTSALSSRFLADIWRLGSGTTMGQLIVVGISPLLSRLFPPTEFGVYAVVVASGSLIATFSSLCLEMIVPVTRRDSEALRLMQLMVLLSSVVAAVTLAVILTFRNEFESVLLVPGGSWALLPLPAFVLAYASYSAIRAWCIRKARFGGISRSQIVRAVALTVAWLGLGFAGFIKAPALALTLGHVLGDCTFAVALSRVMSPREWTLLRTPRPARIRAAFQGYATNIRALVLSQGIAVTHGRLPLFVIATAYGPLQAGYYVLAERLATAPLSLISAVIGDVYRQRAAREWRAGRRFDGLMRRVLALTLLVSVIPFSLAILLAPDYVGLVLGAEWDGAGFTVAALLVGALFAFNSNPVDKNPVIVGANRYMILWHTLRLAGELAAAAGALTGLLTYNHYLVASVGARCGLYVVDTCVGFALASGRTWRLHRSAPTRGARS